MTGTHICSIPSTRRRDFTWTWPGREKMRAVGQWRWGREQCISAQDGGQRHQNSRREKHATVAEWQERANAAASGSGWIGGQHLSRVVVARQSRPEHWPAVSTGGQQQQHNGGGASERARVSDISEGGSCWILCLAPEAQKGSSRWGVVVQSQDVDGTSDDGKRLDPATSERRAGRAGGPGDRRGGF